MRNQNNIRMGIILAVLCAGLTVAEESSVKNIMAELNRVESAKPAAGVAEPVAAEPVIAPAESLDVEALLEESQTQYADGEFEQAAAGFNAVLTAEPKNSIAALYRKQIDKLLHRTAEEDAMDEADESWRPGEEQRYYPLTEKALMRMGLSNVNEPTHVESKFPFVKFPEAQKRLPAESTKISVRNTFENHQESKRFWRLSGSRNHGVGKTRENRIPFSPNFPKAPSKSLAF